MRARAGIALLFVLAACTTQAEREVARMNQATTVALAEMAQCSARAEASEPFRRLRAKLPPVDGTLPSAALLADRSRPTEREAALLVELHTNFITPCRKVVIERLVTINLVFAEVTARNFADAVYGDADTLGRGVASALRSRSSYGWPWRGSGRRSWSR